MDDIRGLDASNAPEVISAKANRLLPTNPLSGKGEGQDQPTDGKEELDTVMPRLEDLADKVAGRRAGGINEAEMVEGHSLGMIGDDGHDGDESKAIDLWNKVSSSGGDSGQMSEEFEFVLSRGWRPKRWLG